MQDLKLWLITVASCLVLCHAMPQPEPEPEPDVNVNVNIDVNNQPGDGGGDTNVDVNVNIGDDDSNSTNSVEVEVECTCGKLNTQNRIIGGINVDTKLKYPWHVGLLSWGSYFCGGTIINNLFILSAAHCFYGYDGPDIPSDIQIGIGDHDQYSDLDNIDGITINASVALVHLHPQYDNDIIDHDFSLIQLSTPIHFGDTLRPICLPENDLSTYEGETGTIIGWGSTGSWNFPDILQEAQVTILDPTCNNYDYYDISITETMLCASYPDKDSCQGDSGGSIAVVEGRSYVQVGVTSWGIGCAVEGHPGVYSRVSSVLRWIHQICSDVEWCPRE